MATRSRRLGSTPVTDNTGRARLRSTVTHLGRADPHAFHAGRAVNSTCAAINPLNVNSELWPLADASTFQSATPAPSNRHVAHDRFSHKARGMPTFSGCEMLGRATTHREE
jgi:hypothetical protein